MKETEFKEELKKLSIDGLQEKLDATRRELFGIRLNAATAHVKDYSQYKKLQRDIARILTIINQKKKMVQQAPVEN